MKLKDILERLGVVRTEMRAIYDVAAEKGEDLAGEPLDKWNALQAELTDLEAKETRARQREELDRTAEGRPLDTRVQEGDAWALKPEQRMTSFLKATTGQDCTGLSLGRLVAAAHRGDWKGADAEKRVMGTFPNVVGGFLVPEVISGSIIDLVRNASVLSRAGAITIPISSNNVTLVRVLTDPTASWRGEGQTISESDANFDATMITPTSLAVLCRVNAELLDDVPSFASTLDGILAASIAVKLDYAGLYGTGTSSQPLGLRNATGITESSMGTNGATPTTYDNLLDLIRDVQLQNGNPTTLVWSPRTVNTYAKIVTGIASDKTKLAPPADVTALRKLVSNQISVTETQGSSGVASTVFIGGFENVGLVMRQTLQIESSRVSGTAFEKNQVLVRAILRADVAKLRPQLIGRLIGVLA